MNSKTQGRKIPHASALVGTRYPLEIAVTLKLSSMRRPGARFSWTLSCTATRSG